MRTLLFLSLALGVVLADQPQKKVLVYTRNYTPDGKGYVHANIPDSIKAIKKMGAENGFAVDASDDPKLFTFENLKQYKALIFSNSNNEAFENDQQRDAFKKYIESGGGLVGIHSATGSERKWPYYWTVIGGSFARHPPLQKFTVRVKDRTHPATKQLGESFDWEDECYFNIYLNPNLHPLLTADPKKLNDPQRAQWPMDMVGDSLPIAWTLNTGHGGRVFYTALGHKPEYYTNPLFTQHLLGGILWVLEDKK